MHAVPIASVIVPLRLAPPTAGAAVARRLEPVTVGVPVPQGRVRGEGAWSVSYGGRTTPAQSAILDRWADGSARWVLLDFAVDHDGGSDAPAAAHWRPSAGEQPSSAIAITSEAGGVTVDTGAARFRLERGAAGFPFAEVAVGDRRGDRAMGGALRVLTGERQSCLVRVERVVVEEPGPLRAVAALDAAIVRPDGRLLLSCLARVHFYAGLPTVRLLLRIRNPRKAEHPGGFWDLGSGGSVYLEELTLEFAITGEAAPAGLQCSVEPGMAAVEMHAPFELYQDSSGGARWKSANHVNRERRSPVSFRGYRLRSGDTTLMGRRATPVVVGRRGAAFIGMSRPQFWQNFPTSISSDGESVEVGLWAGACADVHEIQGGEQKTHEVFVSFGEDGVTSQPLDWCRQRLFVTPTPDWFVESGVIPWLPSSGDFAPYDLIVNAAMEPPYSFEAKREIVDEYGWRHYGDLYGDHEGAFSCAPEPIVSHFNNQYDAVGGLTLRFMRTGDTRWWSCATDLARHVIDIDVYHTTEDKAAYNHGMFWHTYHYGDADTSTHRTYPRSGRPRTHGGGPSADHNYSTGLMWYHFLTGDADARQTVIDLAQYAIDIDDGRRTVFRWLSRGPTGLATASATRHYHGPGRSPANSLNALLNGHTLTGDDRFLAKAEEIIRRCVHPGQEIATLRLTEDPESRWFYVMFLQALGRYLHHKADLGQLDFMYAYARDTLLHFARWMADHEYPYLDTPERLEFPTETWAAQDVRKSDVFVHAARYATGAERDRFIERAFFFWSTPLATLAGLPTRTFCRPIVILLSTGLMYQWLKQHPSDRAPAGPQVEFGAFTPFVPQRTIAVRRFQRLAASAAGLAGAGLTLLLAG